MSERNSTNGRMTTQFTAWCGRVGCVCWCQVDSDSKKAAAKDLKYYGWRLTRKYGWLCPGCQTGEYTNCGSGSNYSHKKP